MRWTIVRLIWLRELRDQLRDRRTMFVMVVLPLLLYPLGGIGLMQIATAPGPKVSVLGIVGAERVAEPHGEYPALLQREQGRFEIDARFFTSPNERVFLAVRRLDAPDNRADLRKPLERGEVDLLLEVPGDYEQRLLSNQPVLLMAHTRPDDRSRLAFVRANTALNLWNNALKEKRFELRGLERDFDRPVVVVYPDLMRDAQAQPMKQIFELLTRVFPFVLVLWSLAGALPRRRSLRR